MPTPTEQSLDNIKIHKVPNLEIWEQNYKTTENPNGLIEPGDLVSFPPNLLGEVLPDYPETAGTTFLKAVTTVNGNNTETVTSWGESASGDTITIDSSSLQSGIPTSAVVSAALANKQDTLPTQSSSTNEKFLQTVYNNGSSSLQWIAAPVTSVNTQTGNVSLTAANVGAISSSEKGVASGVASLDTDIKVKADQATAKIIDSATLTFNSNIHSLKTIENGCLIVDTNSGTDEHIYQIEPYNSSSTSFYHYSTGTEIEIMKIGTGIVKIQPNSGVSLNGATALKTISDQYMSAVLKCIASNEWVVQGAIS